MLFPVKFRVALVGLVVAGGGAAALALGPVSAAVGQSSPPTSPIQVQVTANSPATLVANGTEVDVSVTATCSGPDVDSAYVGVTLTEAVDGDIANGFGSTNVDCTGTSQTADIVVVAYTSSPVGTPTTVPFQNFKKGPAIADTQIYGCDYTYSCVSQEVYPVIKISKLGRPVRSPGQTIDG
jgi:hypothetical protein